MKAVYTVAGVVLVGVGFVGIFVPGLPTTVFMILALFCFKRGSSRLENWLLNHRRFGPTLSDWERHRSIKPRTKVIAITTMWAFIAVSFIFVPNGWVLAAVAALGAFATWYIGSRPSLQSSSSPLVAP